VELLFAKLPEYIMFQQSTQDIINAKTRRTVTSLPERRQGQHTLLKRCFVGAEVQTVQSTQQQQQLLLLQQCAQ